MPTSCTPPTSASPLDETGNGPDIAQQNFDAYQPVEAGDYIGITLTGTSSIGYLNGAGDQIFEVPGNL